MPAIAKIAFTSKVRVRKVIHNFIADGFDYPVRRTQADTRQYSPCPNATRS